jgi:hypothetical protein
MRIRLPPPLLLKVGDFYFVYDGHHRASVARVHGVATIEADVIEYDAHAPYLKKPGVRPSKV